MLQTATHALLLSEVARRDAICHSTLCIATSTRIRFRHICRDLQRIPLLPCISTHTIHFAGRPTSSCSKRLTATPVMNASNITGRSNFEPACLHLPGFRAEALLPYSRSHPTCHCVARMLGYDLCSASSCCSFAVSQRVEEWKTRIMAGQKAFGEFTKRLKFLQRTWYSDRMFGSVQTTSSVSRFLR